MKKNYFLILIALFFGVLTVTKAQKQKHTQRYYNSWRLGLNMGAMWQVADVRSTAGFAGGFTLEKGLCENETNFFSLAIKGRGLWGNTYGLDYTRNYDLKNNPSLNGTYDPRVNYDTAMVGIAPFIYNNYKTKIAEGALELQLSFNRLRERTNVLLNIWGGIGFTSYRTAINLLDGDSMYNYNLVNSGDSKALVLSSHEFLLDDSYESFGTGSKRGNVFTLSPSCGIGLGYRFNDHISLLWEHKITFPQGLYSDYLDGIKGSNNDWLGCVKDYYHYSGLTLQIRLGGKSKSKTSNVNNYTPAQTNTLVNVPTNTIVTNPTNSIVTTTQAKPPIVNITNPPTTPYNETLNRNFNITADVYNIAQRNQLYVTFNNTPITNYSWNGKTIKFTSQLNVGNNVVSVTATNSAGSDSKSAVINYSGVPPQITITTPGNSKYTSSSVNSDIFATIVNVESAQDISVTLNGQSFYGFNYDVMSKVFSMNAALITGTNTVIITAVNLFGQDQKIQLIIYKPTSITTSTGTLKPVTVVITDPSVNPYKSLLSTYKVKATVTGVNSQSQVTVTANSIVVPFNYNNGAVDFNVALNTGNNLIQVSANNGRQSDSKSTVIVFEAPKKITPPTVVIVDPNPSPKVSNNTVYPFKAQTTFIYNKSELVVKYNGVVISDYAFAGGIIDYNGTLIPNSNNTFEVKATNQYGSASASGVVIQEQPKTKVICHKTFRAATETITILESDWPMHQAHGDYEGPCQKAVEDPIITICHKNPDGSQETITIVQSAWAEHQAHGDIMGKCPKIITETPIDNDITVCHMNPDGSKQTLVIKQSAWAQHQAHGDVMGVCPKVITETPLDKDITICHLNPDGSKQTIVIKESTWPQHQSHGDVMGVCPKVITETPLDRDITICHLNPDGSKQTIVIKESTWPQHQSHGDVMGVCPKVVTETSIDQDITICHKNADGSKQTMVIKESTWPQHQAHGDAKGECPKFNDVELSDPDMVICHKNNDGSLVKLTIKASQWLSHQAHGDFVGGECSANTNTATTTSTIEICHNNGDGTKTTMIIPVTQYTSHRAHGDVMGKCQAESVNTNTTTSQPPMTICHNNGDGTKTTMTITTTQWSAHRAHGDALGVCPPEEKKIQICHIPPGNNQNPQTIEIPESAWPAHEAHGDTKGACPEGGKGKGEESGTGKGKQGGEVKSNTESEVKDPGRFNQIKEEPKKIEEPKQEGIKMKPR